MNEKTLFVCFILLMVGGGIAVFWWGERWARRKHAEDAAELQRCMSAPRPDATPGQINGSATREDGHGS